MYSFLVATCTHVHAVSLYMYTLAVQLYSVHMHVLLYTHWTLPLYYKVHIHSIPYTLHSVTIHVHSLHSATVQCTQCYYKVYTHA